VNPNVMQCSAGARAVPECHTAMQVGTPKEMEVDLVIGADGANSRVAREIDAGDYDYAIAFQERIKICDEDMEYYKDLAEMYVGDDVSPDFYGWVFPKYDHVAVGTGTVVNKTAIKQYQQATRDRSEKKTRGGKIIRVEAHPIPEHPRAKRMQGRVGLVGDAAGYVTKCSGEGIYFAAKSGRMCAEAIVQQSQGGKVMVRPNSVTRCSACVASNGMLASDNSHVIRMLSASCARQVTGSELPWSALPPKGHRRIFSEPNSHAGG
jgi:geranylgeranyl reductase